MHRPHCSRYIQAVWWVASPHSHSGDEIQSVISLVNKTLGQALFLCDLWVYLPAGLLPFDLSMGQGQQRWGEVGGKEDHQQANDLQTSPAYRILQAISPHLNTDHRSHFQYCFLQCLYSNRVPRWVCPPEPRLALTALKLLQQLASWTALGALLPPKQSPTMGRGANKESLLELGDPKDQL